MSKAKDFEYQLNGSDPGNTNTKLSYLTKEGNIAELAVPTAVAHAPSHVSNLGSSKTLQATDNLHIFLQPLDDTDGFIKGGYYWVGPAAKLSGEVKEARDGQNKHDSQVHMITMITLEAVAARLNGSEGTVVIPPSSGLPVKLIKDGAREAFLSRIKGSFQITFIDGMFKNDTLIIKHEVDESAPASRYIHAEATKAGMGMGFNVKNFEMIENNVDQSVIDPKGALIVSDPGGYTYDVATFEPQGINSSLTTTYEVVPPEFAQAKLADLVGKKVGGNHIVERLQDLVNNKIIDIHKENDLPLFQDNFFRDRAEFIDIVLKPYIEALVAGEEAPRIVRSFGYATNVDLTDIIVPVLDEYGNIVFNLNMMARQKASSIGSNIIVGGGVLLGYKVLRDRQTVGDPKAANKIKLYELPPKEMIESSPFINARGYLIEAMLNNPDIVEVLIKQNSKVKK
ncbi:hypothetical protein [Brevibacillus reuszeri]|uniref:hypothetical protein n=1 Tax=Brevibacillus reuszeri TaxID=54915 RepID=UPI000CCC2A5F|nr:hypothetical protein [Brevibacillus reuszeri]